MRRLLLAMAVLLSSAPAVAAEDVRHLVIKATGPSRMTVRFDKEVRLNVTAVTGLMRFDGIAGFVFLPERPGGPMAGWLMWSVGDDWDEVSIGGSSVVLPAGSYTLLTTASSGGATYEIRWSEKRDRTLRPTSRVEQAWSSAVWDMSVGQQVSGEALAPIRTASTFVLAYAAYDVVGTEDDRALVCLDIPMPTYPRGCPGRYRKLATRPVWAEPAAVDAVWRTANFVGLPRRNYSVEFELSASGVIRLPRAWVYTLG